MADSLIYPELFYFQWATPDDPNPRLARSCSAAATTLYCTVIPYDADGNLITGKFLMGVKNQAGYVETVYVPAGAGSIEGTTYKMTGVIRGIALEGLDFDTGNPDLAVPHQQDDPVFCNISGVIQALVAEKLVFPIFADTTERDTEIPSPVNGKSRCYVTADGLYYLYAAGSWQSVDSGTVTPNASTTVAGKVEIATQSEANAGTDTGGTGALLSVVPSNLAVLSQDNKYTYAGTTAGSSTVYTATVTPAPAAYAAGQGFTVLMDETNGASPTINFNGLGAKSIVDASGAAIAAGILPSGALVDLKYNGTSFQVMNISLSKTPVVNVYSMGSALGSSSTRFDITNPSGTTFRYTYDGTGTDPNINSTTFPVGATVSIFDGGGGIVNSNTGSFIVTGSGNNYFEVTNAAGSVQTNIVLNSNTALYVATNAAWIKPAGLKYLIAEVVGGGGGGGGMTTAGSGAGGGGGGGYARKLIISGSLGATETVLVGGGGRNGAGTGAVGGTGLTSSFGSHLQATGGAGGNSPSGTGTGGDGGIGTLGDLNAKGGAGVSGSTTIQAAGSGGSSVLGGGGAGFIGDTNGNQGGFYGGGGGGAASSGSDRFGGAGGGGVVIVTEYY